MKRANKVLLAIGLILLGVLAGSTLTMWGMAGQHAVRTAVSEHAADGADPIRAKLEEISGYLETYFIDDYDQETIEQAAEDAAAQGMVAATGDRWSYYISEAEMQAHDERFYNSYVGIGVVIRMEEDGLKIVSVNEGSTAQAAGIVAGDILWKVEGRMTKDLGTEGTKELVRGEEGTTVHLTLLRDGEPLELDVKRASIVSDVATLTMLEGDLAWIRIVNFDHHCAEQTLACVAEAREQGAKGLLFDVRFNPGGLKNELVKVLDALLPEGKLFISRDYAGKEEIDTSDPEFVDLPMVVLINEDSYSAAEFFAAALQEYEAAEIVGMQTSGKGNFQYTLPLSDGSAVAISAGKYYTPSEKSLTDVGVQPDVEADLDYEDFEALFYGILAPEDDEQLAAAVKTLEKQIAAAN